MRRVAGHRTSRARRAPRARRAAQAVGRASQAARERARARAGAHACPCGARVLGGGRGSCNAGFEGGFRSAHAGHRAGACRRAGPRARACGAAAARVQLAGSGVTEPGGGGGAPRGEWVRAAGAARARVRPGSLRRGGPAGPRRRLRLRARACPRRAALNARRRRRGVPDGVAAGAAEAAGGGCKVSVRGFVYTIAGFESRCGQAGPKTRRPRRAGAGSGWEDGAGDAGAAGEAWAARAAAARARRGGGAARAACGAWGAAGGRRFGKC